MSEIFNEALSNFTYDMASGGAIRHLFDLGYTAEEMVDMLDYPTPLSKIKETIAEYQKQKELPPEKQYTYVKEYDAYGRASFRRVPLSETEEKQE